MFIPLFGPERELRDPPGPAELVEEVILTMIERSKGYKIDTGDVAALLSLEFSREQL